MDVFGPQRIFVPVSVAMFLAEAAYALSTIGTQARLTNSSVPLILLSVVVFLIGFVPAEISSFGFAGPRT
jgi:hypothetical protein